MDNFRFVIAVFSIFIFGFTVGDFFDTPEIAEVEKEVIRVQTEYHNIPISDSEKFKKCESNYGTYTYIATFGNSLVGFDLEEKCEF